MRNWIKIKVINYTTSFLLQAWSLKEANYYRFSLDMYCWIEVENLIQKKKCNESKILFEWSALKKYGDCSLSLKICFSRETKNPYGYNIPSIYNRKTFALVLLGVKIAWPSPFSQTVNPLRKSDYQLWKWVKCCWNSSAIISYMLV